MSWKGLFLSQYTKDLFYTLTIKNTVMKVIEGFGIYTSLFDVYKKGIALGSLDIYNTLPEFDHNTYII